MPKLDEILLGGASLKDVEDIIRDSTDMYLGEVVLKSTTLMTLVHRFHELQDVALKIRPMLRALAGTDKECARLLDKLEKVLPDA